MTEHAKTIKEVLNWAIYHDIVENRTEFCAAIGINNTTLSCILNGRMSGKNTAKKAQEWKDSLKDGMKVLSDRVPPLPESNWAAFRIETSRQVLLQILNYGFAEDCVEEQVALAVHYADELTKCLRK
jgi:hypothetical protein